MEPKTTKKPSRKLVVFKRELPFYLMLIPGVTFLIIFSYLPMFGLVMAFQDFTPLRSFKNSPWVGLKNFHDMLALPTFWNVVGNTLSISIAKIILRQAHAPALEMRDGAGPWVRPAPPAARG